MITKCVTNLKIGEDVSIGNKSGKSLALRTISREVVAQDGINTFTNQSIKVSHCRSNKLIPQLVDRLRFYSLECKIGDNMASDVAYW